MSSFPIKMAILTIHSLAPRVAAAKSSKDRVWNRSIIWTSPFSSSAYVVHPVPDSLTASMYSSAEGNSTSRGCALDCFGEMAIEQSATALAMNDLRLTGTLRSMCILLTFSLTLLCCSDSASNPRNAFQTNQAWKGRTRTLSFLQRWQKLKDKTRMTAEAP